MLESAREIVRYWTEKDEPQYAENWQVRVEQLEEQSFERAKKLRTFAALKPDSKPAKYCIEKAQELETL